MLCSLKMHSVNSNKGLYDFAVFAKNALSELE